MSKINFPKLDYPTTWRIKYPVHYTYNAYYADDSLLYCAQNVSGLPSPYAPIYSSGSFVYCNQSVNGLPSPYAPITPSGFIVYCSFDTSELPKP